MPFEINHTVTLAGSGFGFFLFAMTVLVIAGQNEWKWKSLRRWKKLKGYLVPWAFGLVVMVLASFCAGGVLEKASGFFTATGNNTGTIVATGLVGGDGSAGVARGAALSYQGSWIALTLFFGMLVYLKFAKGESKGGGSGATKARLLVLSGAVTGSTWGLAVGLGGLATSSVPVANWLGQYLIGG